MPAKLYIVQGSHPCMTVARALELKGIPYRTVELPELAHIPYQRIRFGASTVPGVRFEDGARAQGSRPILRVLDERVPEPALLPADPALRTRVEELERWGDEELQAIARRLAWWGVHREPGAIPSYTEGSRWALPAPIARRVGRGVARIVMRVHDATDETTRADVAALPGHVARIEEALEEGVLGGDPPNAADLQLAPSMRLLMTYEDLAPLFESGRAAGWARGLFPDVPGRLPAGTLPV